MRLRFWRPSGLSFRILAYTLMILSGGVLTGSAYIFVQQRVTARTNHALETLTNNYATSLARQIERHGDLLYATRAFCTTSTVTTDSWKHFIYNQNASERYPALRSLAYAKVVPSVEIDAYQLVLQKGQNPNASLYPLKESGDYVTVTYHEQLRGGNQPSKAIGFDVSSDPERNHTLQEAKRTRHIAATGPLGLITDNRPGFLMILPLSWQPSAPTMPDSYGIAAFDIADLVEQVLGKELAESHTALTITDISEDQPQKLYGQRVKNWGRTVKRQMTIDVANRHWQLDFATPTSSLVMAGDRLAPTAVLIIGSSFLLLTVVVIRAYHPRHQR